MNRMNKIVGAISDCQKTVGAISNRPTTVMTISNRQIAVGAISDCPTTVQPLSSATLISKASMLLIMLLFIANVFAFDDSKKARTAVLPD